MTFLEKIELIRRVDALIRRKGTGTADELAEKLEISRSAVYYLIECMTNMGAEIEYCRNMQSFYYVNQKVLAIGYLDEKKIVGGKNNLKSFEDFLVCPKILDN